MKIRPVIAAVGAAAALAIPAATAAQAETVHQFSFQLENTTADGSYTAALTTRTFDTTGAPPVPMTSNTIRIPAGVAIRREFLGGDYFCDGRAMIDGVTSGKPYSQSWVAAFKDPSKSIARLRRIGTRADRRLISKIETCDRARIGFGRATVDARPAIPEEIPADVIVFLSRPTRGAVATISAIGIPDPRAEIVRRNGILRDVRALVDTTFVNDPSADGRYGYKLVLPTGRIAGFQVSVAKLDLTATGLTIRRGARSTFWLTRPTCPASGRLSFESFYGYAPPLESRTSMFELPCPRYG